MRPWMPPFLFASSYHIFAACSASRPNAASWPDIGANSPMVISLSVMPGSAAGAFPINPADTSSGQRAAFSWFPPGSSSVDDQPTRSAFERQAAAMRRIVICPPSGCIRIEHHAAAIRQLHSFRVQQHDAGSNADPRCRASRSSPARRAASAPLAAARSPPMGSWWLQTDRHARAVPDGRDRRGSRSSGPSTRSRRSSARSAFSSPAPAR